MRARSFRRLPSLVLLVCFACQSSPEAGPSSSVGPAPGRDVPFALDFAPHFGEPLHGFTFGVPTTQGDADQLASARYDPDRRRLFIEPGGSFTSHTIRWHVPFDELLLSWNVTVPEDAGLVVEISVGGPDEDWSPWLHLGDWGRRASGAERVVAFDGGRVDVDVFRGERTFDRVRYRLTALAGDADALVVHQVALCLSDTRRLAALDPGALSPRAHEAALEVPPRSQRDEGEELAPRVCSPTSVAMVLAWNGVDKTTAEVAALLYDAEHDLYGNWPRAVQGAFELGVPGTLIRLSSWSAVEHFLLRGVPLIVSVRADPGELRGAPYEKTSGHLLVLTGFDADGRVLVNDPAAPSSAEVERHYFREDLEQVWMRNGGVAYAIGAGK